MNTEERVKDLFVLGIGLIQQGFFIDAKARFFEIADQYPESELADDALYNAGLCSFHINAFEQAIGIFNDVIGKYPDGAIYTHGTHPEYGKTAAKAHYAIMNCYLGMARYKEAKLEAEKLKAFPESHLITDLGEKITFASLAAKAIDTYSQFNIG